jgi:hypothetical protein
MTTLPIDLVLHVKPGTTQPQYLLDNYDEFRKLASARSLKDYGHDNFKYTTIESVIEEGVNTGPDLPEVNPAFFYNDDPFQVLADFESDSNVEKVYGFIKAADVYAARDLAILESPRAMDIMIDVTNTPGLFKVGYIANQIETASQMANFKRLFPDVVEELCEVHEDPTLFTECMSVLGLTSGGGSVLAPVPVVAPDTFRNIAVGVTLLAVTLALLVIWLK